MKHVRGIFFDDAEKSRRGSGGGQSNTNKSPLIHLEINPIPLISRTAKKTSSTESNAKSALKFSQDDSVLNFKVSSQDLSTRGKE